MQKGLNSRTIKNISKIPKNEVKFNDYIMYKLYYYNQKENDDNIGIDDKGKEAIKYFDENDELEIYNKKSKKECIEYGLKSSNEEIVICKKYE